MNRGPQDDNEEDTNEFSERRSCLESCVRCTCLPCLLCIGISTACCCPRGCRRQTTTSPYEIPPQWTRTFGVVVSILRTVSSHVVRNIRCIRLLTDHRIPTWLPGLPGHEVRVVSQDCSHDDKVVPTPSSCPVPGEWTYLKHTLDPRDTPPSRVVLYLHGGGFGLCSPETHRGVLMTLVSSYGDLFANRERRRNSSNDHQSDNRDEPLHESQEDGIAIFAVDYRRPPEHKFPVPLQDCIAAYRWLVDRMGGTGDRIVLAGDSAGGTLVALVLFALQEQQQKAERLPLPAGGILISPWVDLLDTTLPSWHENAAYDFLTPGLAHVLATAVGSSSVQRQHVSPTNYDMNMKLCGNLSPLWIMTGEREVLRDQVVTFAKKLQEGGAPDVQCIVEPGMVHVFPVFSMAVEVSLAKGWFDGMAEFIHDAYERRGNVQMETDHGGRTHIE